MTGPARLWPSRVAIGLPWRWRRGSQWLPRTDDRRMGTSPRRAVRGEPSGAVAAVVRAFAALCAVMAFGCAWWQWQVAEGRRSHRRWPLLNTGDRGPARAWAGGYAVMGCVMTALALIAW